MRVMRVTCEWHASDMRVTLSPCGIGRCRKRWAPWPRCSAAWVRLCCCSGASQRCLGAVDMATYGNCQVVTCRDIWHLHLFIRKFEFRCRTVDLSPKIETKTTQSHSVFVAMEQECDLQLPMCPFHLLLVALSNFATTCSDVYLLFSFITCNFAR